MATTKSPDKNYDQRRELIRQRLEFLAGTGEGRVCRRLAENAVESARCSEPTETAAVIVEPPTIPAPARNAIDATGMHGTCAG